MRNQLIFVVLFFSALGAIGLGSPGSKISELPDGIFSGNVYLNDVLGLRYEVPSGWIATADPKGPVSLDSRKPDGPVNQCSKILLLLHAPQQGEGRFNSKAAIFAVDPGCFSDAKFPKSLKDKQRIQQFADKIVKLFSNTPYISRRGAYIDAVRQADRLIIILTQDDVMSAAEEPDRATKESLHVNLLFCLTESHGYWVAWTALADDPAKEEFKKGNLQFKVAR